MFSNSSVDLKDPGVDRQPTWGSGGWGLVLLRLDRLSEHTVDLDHVHPLAQLVLQLG